MEILWNSQQLLPQESLFLLTVVLKSHNTQPFHENLRSLKHVLHVGKTKNLSSYHCQNQASKHAVQVNSHRGQDTLVLQHHSQAQKIKDMTVFRKNRICYCAQYYWTGTIEIGCYPKSLQSWETNTKSITRIISITLMILKTFCDFQMLKVDNTTATYILWHYFSTVARKSWASQSSLFKRELLKTSFYLRCDHHGFS